MLRQGATLTVDLSQAQGETPAPLTPQVTLDILTGSIGSGRIELRGVALVYCVPRAGVDASQDTIERKDCVHEAGNLLQLSIPSLRFTKAFEACPDVGNQPLCFFPKVPPNQPSPLTLEVFSDVGHYSPPAKAWKSNEDITIAETVDKQELKTTFKKGPCHHPKFVDLLVFVGYQSDTDAAYSTYSNNNQAFFTSSTHPSTRFKLICK